MSARILIIDDDEHFRKLLVIRLRSFIKNPILLEFTNLNDARSGLASMQAINFDLVVLDQHLPDGIGLSLLEEGILKDLTVLAVSSDSSPDIPGRTISAGAAYFLAKDQVRSPLFQPLVQGVMDRNRLQRELLKQEVDKKVIELVKTHIGTLRHEVNNPLGAVLGAAFLLRNSSEATQDQVKAAELVEKSGIRIKHVLDQICEALESGKELEQVNKAEHMVFHIPGDEPWNKGKL